MWRALARALARAAAAEMFAANQVAAHQETQDAKARAE